MPATLRAGCARWPASARRTARDRPTPSRRRSWSVRVAARDDGPGGVVAPGGGADGPLRLRRRCEPAPARPRLARRRGQRRVARRQGRHRRAALPPTRAPDERPPRGDPALPRGRARGHPERHPGPRGREPLGVVVHLLPRRASALPAAQQGGGRTALGDGGRLPGHTTGQGPALLDLTGAVFPQVADPGGELADELRLTGLPGILLVDRDGKVTFLLRRIDTYADLVRLVRDHTGVDVGAG